MTSPTQPNDYALAYDQAIIALQDDPDNYELKHQAVLALARAGSLDLALAEYKRYGLDDIRHHEDIMALGARLLKDLYLVNTGAKAKGFAQSSAQKYEAAFEDTGGYYSGINAATMSLLAGVPGEIVQGRAQTILEKLPKPNDLDKESLYYIVATRAEAQLLLGDKAACAAALRRAVDHDPLNYTAHATTLKQFRMILQKRSEDTDWLRAYAPPKSIHFAGHMFGAIGETNGELPALSQAQIGALQIEISDTLQREDIGFGYGALAAGADILCAQALLEEGGELHVVLPVGQKVFLENSVTPFGRIWVDRFHECLAQAASVRIVTSSDIWPNPALNCHAGQIAMGGAVMKAESLSAMPAQLLIWDGSSGKTGTAKHAQDWQASSRAQININYPGERSAKSPLFSETTSVVITAALAQTGNAQTKTYTDASEAVAAALDLRRTSKTPVRAGLHIGPERDDNVAALAKLIAARAVPGSILVSEDFAGVLHISCPQAYKTNYMGRLDIDDPNSAGLYSLQKNARA